MTTSHPRPMTGSSILTTKARKTAATWLSATCKLKTGITPRDLAHLVALYDGEIAHTDDHVGQALQVLRDMGLAEKTLLIIVSDHGEGFLEHGWILHGNSLFEELVHVPLILRLPGVIPAGRRIQDNASQVDVMPTVLGLLGIAAPGDLQGIDLSRACRGLGGLPDRVIFSETKGSLDNVSYLRAVRWGPYKLIQQKGCLPMPLLVVRGGIESDAQKAGLDDKERHKLEELLAEALASGPAPSGRPNRAATRLNIDEATLRRLKSLGYVQ